jgi:hypothetical protein
LAKRAAAGIYSQSDRMIAKAGGWRGDPLSVVRHWLTPAQILLLRATLLGGDDAVKAWRTWRATADLDKLDTDSNRLLPLAWKNLTNLGVRDPWFDRLKGVYRYHWARNQLLLAEAFKAVRLLQNAGISVMLLKGFVMIVHYYRDAGLRPVADFDLMVPLDKAEVAAETLSRGGWRLHEPAYDTFNSVRPCSHAAFFTNQCQAIIDLHWHLFLDDRRPGADDEHWQYARVIETHGLTVKIPSSTDLFFHICAHGAWGRPSPIRWVADSVTLLRYAGDEVDWPRFVAQARERWFSLPLLAATSYLREEFGAPVPIETIRALSQGPHRWLERMELRKRMCRFGVVDLLSFHWLSYLRTTRDCSAWQKLNGIPRHFQRVWNLKRPGQIPGYVARRAIERLRMKLQRRASSP